MSEEDPKQPKKNLAEPVRASVPGNPRTEYDNGIANGNGGNGTSNVDVTLQRAGVNPTNEQALWAKIRSSADGMSFNNYKSFMDAIMCDRNPAQELTPEQCASFHGCAQFNTFSRQERALPFGDMDAYRRLKAGTEVFLMCQCGVVNFSNSDFLPEDHDFTKEARRHGFDTDRDSIIEAFENLRVPVTDETGGIILDGDPQQPFTLPYLDLVRRKLGDLPIKSGRFGESGTESAEVVEACYGILLRKLTSPCLIELIWSYWHEEALLVQTLNAINLRFQNRSSGQGPDPLAHLEVGPLRLLNNLLWGYIQDEQHRLTMRRRSYEYSHHYGIHLQGKAVPKLNPADDRSKFIEAFHNLLHLCSVFYKEDDDTTVIADGFPVLNSLKEVHNLLSQGAHNQYGDLPWTARQEMLMEMWLLARPEMREFLPSREMVANPEPWMDRVESMKTIQGWNDTSTTFFRNLGVYGEQLLLSARFGITSNDNDPATGANWARYWRPEIQNYIHSYRAVAGVDLSEESVRVNLGKEAYLPPSVHLARRQQRPGPARSGYPQAPNSRNLSRNGGQRRTAAEYEEEY